MHLPAGFFLEFRSVRIGEVPLQRHQVDPLDPATAGPDGQFIQDVFPAVEEGHGRVRTVGTRKLRFSLQQRLGQIGQNRGISG